MAVPEEPAVPQEGKTPGADAPPSLPKEGRDGLLFRDDPLARPEMMTVLDDGSGGFEQATGYYANRYTAREISFMMSMVEGGFTPEESLALLRYMNEQSAGPLMTPNLSATELRQILPDTDFTITRRGVDEAVNAAALVRLSYQVAMFHMTLADAETNLQKQRSAEQQALLNFVVYSAALNAQRDTMQRVPDTQLNSSERIERTGTSIHTQHGSQTAVKSADSWFHPDGKPIFPLYDGVIGSPSMFTLQPGTVVDRYGFETGYFVSPQGTPYVNRSLSPGSSIKPFYTYEILKPIDVKAGVVAPWFDQPGGGMQYEFFEAIEDLIRWGFLRRLP
jgi:hypothetical protein